MVQDINALLDILVKAITIAGGLFIIAQLREMQKQRIAQMSWTLFERYQNDDMIQARRVMIEWVRNNEVSNADEYLAKFHNQPEGSSERQKAHSAAHGMRFYQIAGTLLKSRLADRNLIFGIFGAELGVQRPIITIVADGERKAHGSSYLSDIKYLFAQYDEWLRHQR